MVNRVPPHTIASWLQRSGASFEMAIARAMMSRGLSVEQAHYYRDPDEPATFREMDIVAGTGFSVAEDAVFDITAVIECKYATAPWVLFRPPPQFSQEEPHFDRVSTRLGGEWLRRAEFSPTIRALPLFQRESRPAYALGPALDPNSRSGGTDQAYGALHAVVKAAEALAYELEHAANPIRRLSVVLPVVAVRGQLTEAWLEGTEVMVREVSRGQVHWSNPGSENGRFLIDIVTEEEAIRFAQELAHAGQVIKSDVPAHAIDVVAAEDAATAELAELVTRSDLEGFAG